MNGKSYEMRVIKIVKIINKYSALGVDNRTILRKYIYPEFGICEKTMYNYINYYYTVLKLD